MRQFGYFAYRDDPISLAFLGLINRLLKSMMFTATAMTLAIFAGGICTWNGLVDAYVLKNGVQEKVPVTASSYSTGSRNYRAEFSFRGAQETDQLRLIEPMFASSSHGSCTLNFNPRSCNKKLTVVYLPQQPGTFVVKEDYLTAVLRWFLAGLSGCIALGCGSNLLRLGSNQAPHRLPSWADWGFK